MGGEELNISKKKQQREGTEKRGIPEKRISTEEGKGKRMGMVQGCQFVKFNTEQMVQNVVLSSAKLIWGKRSGKERTGKSIEDRNPESITNPTRPGKKPLLGRITDW